MGYHIFLTMVLRARARSSAINTFVISNKDTCWLDKGKKAHKARKYVIGRESHHDQETNDRKHFINLLLFNQGSVHVQLTVSLTLPLLFLLIL